MKKRRLHPGAVFAIIVFLLLLGFGLVMREGSNASGWTPRVAWNDDTPLGGKGWHLLLEHLGYKVRRVDQPLQKIPTDAQVWLLLDPETRFSNQEAESLLQWVQDGHTLMWADTSNQERSALGSETYDAPALKLMRDKLGLPEWRGASFKPRAGLALPPLVPLGAGDANQYRTGADKSQRERGERVFDASQRAGVWQSRRSAIDADSLRQGPRFPDG